METAALSSRNPTRTPRVTADLPAREPQAWWRSTWAAAFAGAGLLWDALPPLDFSPLAWVALVPWVLLIRRQLLSGRRPYATLWLAGFVFWLAALHFLTLPHWATSFGWVAIAFYLAFYLPIFVGLSRVAVHRLNVSVVVAAPMMWTGLELARAHLLGGFAMASLSHTQYRLPEVIQISDVLGSYGVSFLIVLVAASIARMLPCEGARRAWWPIVPAAVALVITLGYGHWRLGQEVTKPGPKVALIQGSIDIEMKHDPTQGARIFDQYYTLSRRAVDENSDLDLIVWPETMFRYPWYTFADDFVVPEGVAWTPEQAMASSREQVASTVARLGVPFLLGIDTAYETNHGTERFNSALLTDQQGKVEGRYDKCHLVTFGEYVPLAGKFPWLYRLTPLPGGLNAGSNPQSFAVGGSRVSPNICYENTIPHFIASQVRQLRAEDREPDVLVNLTNDGWFWGSSELDMHLACAVFRAVECRKPFLIAANTGFSASIDSSGRIQDQGPRRETGLIIARTMLDERQSPYLGYGDLPGGVCLTAVVGLAAFGLWQRRADRRNPASAET